MSSTKNEPYGDTVGTGRSSDLSLLVELFLLLLMPDEPEELDDSWIQNLRPSRGRCLCLGARPTVGILERRYEEGATNQGPRWLWRWRCET
jgi:hypothetical protein